MVLHRWLIQQLFYHEDEGRGRYFRLESAGAIALPVDDELCEVPLNFSTLLLALEKRVQRMDRGAFDMNFSRHKERYAITVSCELRNHVRIAWLLFEVVGRDTNHDQASFTVCFMQRL